MVKFGVLDKLGQKYNTDKASQYTRRGNLTKGHDYLRHYELFLSTLLDEPFTLIELGCYTGASLKMWKEYYAKAHIIGVDLDEKLARLEEERISCVCSDAVADDLPQKLSKFNENIMCIIDDCSHAWGDQRRTFEMLFPMVNSGGFYIIGDYLYYTTPLMELSYPEKKLQNDKMEICRIKLDGTGNERLTTTKNANSTFNWGVYVVDGGTFVVFLDGTNLVSVNAENKKYELALYRYGLKEPQVIPEDVYQLLVFKNKFEDYRSDNYNQERGAWIW